MSTLPTFSAGQSATTEPPRAPCGTCGYLSLLDDHGLVLAHFKERIRRGPDGGPEQYTTATPCDGAGEAPEQVE